MANSASTAVVVPAHNEEDGLPVVLEDLFKCIEDGCEVIVIDDGSTDRTAQVASRFPCRLVRHEMNRGKGEALITGIRCARGANVISIDADGTYPAELVPLIAHALQFYDMVIGSRVLGKENIPPFNRFGNVVLRTLIRRVYGFGPQDPLTGLWGIRKCYAERILPTVRFAPDAEMDIKAARMKLRMLDLPITYKPRIGETKLDPLRGGYEHLKLIVTLLRWQPEEGPGNEPGNS